MCKCTKPCKKNNLVLSQNEAQSKRKRSKFLTALGDFESQYNTAFQSLFSEIIRTWELSFGRLEVTFLANFYTYNEKPLFHLVKTSFF